jgi:hypothetical protein
MKNRNSSNEKRKRRNKEVYHRIGTCAPFHSGPAQDGSSQSLLHYLDRFEIR